MGEGIDIECSQCDYSEIFFLGVGMRHSSLSEVINEVSPARRKVVKKLLASKDVKDVYYEHRLFECPSCHLLAERFDYRIETGLGDVYRPYFLCGRCRTRLIQATEPLAEHACPNCGARPLNINESFLNWD
jgi:predicted RNA-binding Zn-ribbon protein involved in translation (DUF1610 family)